MSKIVQFGENVKGYDVRVLNEREARAGAGILFLFANFAFYHAFLLSSYVALKLFILGFLIDFTIRLFINPKYSPSLILGRIAVLNQKVEYTGAPQKKFAWGLGFILALTMTVLVVIKGITGPVNFIICIACLTFLFFEAAFGICLGCVMYNTFTKESETLSRWCM